MSRRETTMFCQNCGCELPSNVVECPQCGASVGGTGAASEVASVGGAAGMGTASPAASAPAGVGNASVGGPAPVVNSSYEYARTTVSSDLVQVAADCYASLGYELTGSKAEGLGSATSTLSFRRGRGVREKARLAKIQHTMDDLISRISSLEKEKTSGATAKAVAIGTVSALVLGVGICCAMVWTQLMVVGIIVGILGMAGGVLAWWVWRGTVAADTKRLQPQIDAAYEMLAGACDEAQGILRATA